MIDTVPRGTILAGAFVVVVIAGVAYYLWTATTPEEREERIEKEKKRLEEEGPIGWGVIPRVRREIEETSSLF